MDYDDYSEGGGINGVLLGSRIWEGQGIMKGAKKSWRGRAWIRIISGIKYFFKG